MRKLFEKTSDNIEILRDLTDIIINNMPSKIMALGLGGSIFENLSGFSNLKKKYVDTKYGKLFDFLKTVSIVFKNPEKLRDSLGLYIPSERRIDIFVSSFVGECRTVTKEELLAIRRNDSPIKTFRSIIMHELRHAFQDCLYKKYFNKDSKNKKYQSSPIEIDAAWIHHLQDYDPLKYKTGQDYVYAVMNSFSAYKKLRGFERMHYIKKTAAYWFVVNRDRKSSPKTFADRVAALSAAFKADVLLALTKIKDDVDMRSLPNYNPDSRMFFFKYDTFRVVNSIIANDKPVLEKNAPVVFLAMALLGVSKQAALRHLKMYQKITLQMALNNVATTFNDGWDAAAIKRKIETYFS